ncbi:ABC transporter permease [Amycolatopsis sp. GM8]|uniref:ABC transporter permease n=1 Tax=Amycolatopsis sp. GM8 TaxID=2896530 RepID=UPI001F02E273|nr:ABC transporter permease subunit [Amycolatopsis sp. GM8]
MSTTRLNRVGSGWALLLARTALVVVVVALWQVAADQEWVNANFFSSPSDVWHSLGSLSASGDLWRALESTVVVLAIGWVLGELAGLALGIAIGLSKRLNDIIGPIIVFANAVPRILLLPIFVVWYGFGYEPKVLLVVAVMVVFVALNVAAGVREVDGLLVQNMRVHGANAFDLLRHVFFPAVSLWVTSSARVTVGYALQATIGSELLGAESGLGSLISHGQVSFRSDQIIAVLLVAAALAVSVDLLLATLERRAVRWMPKT